MNRREMLKLMGGVAVATSAVSVVTPAANSGILTRIDQSFRHYIRCYREIPKKIFVSRRDYLAVRDALGARMWQGATTLRWRGVDILWSDSPTIACGNQWVLDKTGRDVLAVTS
jgi:hypothetical protein